MLLIPGIYSLQVDPSDPYAEEYLHFAENYTQDKIDNLKFTKDKSIALFSDLFIKYLLLESTGSELSDLKFSRSSSGKPAVSLENIEFNISNSGEMIVCILDRNPVGIDIEFMEVIDTEDANYFLSPEEKAWLDATKKGLKLSLIYTIWTVKEAYLKAMAMSLESINLADLTIIKEGEILGLKQNGMSVADWKFTELDLHPKYKATICTKNDVIRTNVIPISVSTIMNKFSTL